MTPTYTGVRAVIRVSHSLLVSIPADVCRKMNIKKGDQVEITVKPVENLGIKYS